MHYLLTYEVVPDFAARRVEQREAHLAYARVAVGRGELVLGGAIALDAMTSTGAGPGADPSSTTIDGSVFLFRGPTPDGAAAFARADPYVTAGLVARWRVQRWTTVLGADAAARVGGHGAPPATAAAATRAGLLAAMRAQRYWTVSTIAADGAPHAAIVGVHVRDDLALVFDTLDSTRKAADLARDPRVACAMYAGDLTVQLDGRATVLTGDARAAAQRAYLTTFPDGTARVDWPGLVYVQVEPTWARLSDFSGDAPHVVELDAATLARLARA